MPAGVSADARAGPHTKALTPSSPPRTITGERMNPLPRLLAFGLLVILAALSAMLAGPALRSLGIVPAAPPALEASVAPPAPVHRLVGLSQRVAFPVALTGFVIAAALVTCLALRSNRPTEPVPATHAARAEIGVLARLAETSVAQGQELAHERDSRQRAEADALLKQQMLNRSLEEKIRLGRDLHDGIIQSLYAAGLTIEAARAVAKKDPTDADRRLGECRENLNQTIRDVRTYIAGLAPENLRQSGFTQAVHALVEELGADRDVQFELRIDDNATARLSPEQSAEALQIARESVSNSLRHGGATQVTIRLHCGTGEACLLVQDNGRGFDPASRHGTGHGLVNMQARAHGLGGNVRLESAPGTGTRVVLTLPLPEV